ncbi:MAG: phosphate signaling complex protein PhoU [Pseudomonadota bacterium]
MNVAHIVSRFDEELNRIEALLLEMGGLVESQIRKSVEAVSNPDASLIDEILSVDKRVNEMEREIDELTVLLLALRQPVATDLRAAISAMKVAGNLERIGDYAKSMARRAAPIHGDDSVLHLPLQSLSRISEMVEGMLKDVLDAYVARDLEKAKAVWARDDQVDNMYTSLFRELLTYMMENPAHITAGMHLMFVAKNLERTGDHVTNIAEQIHFLLTGDQMDVSDEKLTLRRGRNG